MSTPPNKRDQRRQERLANLENAQAARRSEPEQMSAANDTEQVTATPSAAITAASDSAAPVKAIVTGKTTTRPVGTTAGVSKPTTRPTNGVRARATGVAPGANKATTRPVGAVAGKAPTRPIVAAGGARANAGDDLADDTSAAFVTKRDQRRESRRADLARIQEDRRRARLAQRRKEQRNRYLFIGLTAVIVLLFGFWVVKMLTAPSSSAGTGTIITGAPEAGGYGAQIQCASNEQSAQHIHSNLQIYINGKNVPMPANVGISTSCLYWLHVHDTSGTIHIESPDANGKYFLGDFLAIWQKFPTDWIPAGAPKITSTSFFGMPIDAKDPVTYYVNGKKFTGDPNTLQLYSGENIWLEYGTKQVKPTGYDFGSNGVSP